MKETSLDCKPKADVEQTTDAIPDNYKKLTRKECSRENFTSM